MRDDSRSISSRCRSSLRGRAGHGHRRHRQTGTAGCTPSNHSSAPLTRANASASWTCPSRRLFTSLPCARGRPRTSRGPSSRSGPAGCWRSSWAVVVATGSRTRQGTGPAGGATVPPVRAAPGGDRRHPVLGRRGVPVRGVRADRRSGAGVAPRHPRHFTGAATPLRRPGTPSTRSTTSGRAGAEVLSLGSSASCTAHPLARGSRGGGRRRAAVPQVADGCGPGPRPRVSSYYARRSSPPARKPSRAAGARARTSGLPGSDGPRSRSAWQGRRGRRAGLAERPAGDHRVGAGAGRMRHGGSRGAQVRHHRRAGQRQGHPGHAAGAGLRPRPHQRRRHLPLARRSTTRRSARRSGGSWPPASWSPTTWSRGDRAQRLADARLELRLHRRRLPAQRPPGRVLPRELRHRRRDPPR